MAIITNMEAYREALIVLGAAAIVIPLVRRLKINSVPGFLLTGFLLGPGMLGQLPWASELVLGRDGNLPHIAELGVVFLLFMVGLELSYERLMGLRRLVFGLGLAHLVLSAVILGLIVRLLGADPISAAVIGLALGLSSTAIVVQILADQGRLHSQGGRASFAVLLLQDISVVPILLFAGLSFAGASVLTNAGLALGKAALALGVVVIIGRLALRPLLRWVSGSRSTDLFMAASLLIILSTGLVAGAGGLSMALGAFIAGILLAGTEFRREIETIIEPFRGILLGSFFMVVGSGLDPASFLEQPWLILGLTFGFIAIKALIMLALARFFRVPAEGAITSALMLGPGGEFAFVVLTTAAAAGNVRPDLMATTLLCVSLSMLLIPVMGSLGDGVKARLGQNSLPPEVLAQPEAGLSGHVIVAGFGRVGQLVADTLEAQNLAYIAIDNDAERVARERRKGRPLYYGNATRADFLKHCGIEQASVLAITMDSTAVDRVIFAARKASPETRIIARAKDERHAGRLYQDGVSEAVPETTEASLQLSEAILVAAGLPMGLAIATIHERREQSRKRCGMPDRRAQLGLSRSKQLRDLRES